MLLPLADCGLFLPDDKYKIEGSTTKPFHPLHLPMGILSVLTEEVKILVNTHKLIDKMQDKENYVNTPGAHKSNLSMLFSVKQ